MSRPSSLRPAEEPALRWRVGAARWCRTGVGQCALTAVASPWLIITVALTVYWLHPVEATSLPRDAGPLALSFPLHLLVVTIAALGLGLLAFWLRAWPAAGIFGLAAILSAFLALRPSIAMWRLARQENVSLSLSTYLAYATHRDRGGRHLDRTVEYATAPDHTKLVLDFWSSGVPASGPSLPAIVLVHGGGWTGGRRGEATGWNRWLNQLGYQVFDVEYRLPPPARWRDEVGDVKCALGWVAANAAQYRMDPARISIMGFSAGGNLALLAAYSMGESELPASCNVSTVSAKSVINLYGPADLTLFYAVSGSPTNIQTFLRQYVGGSPSQYADRYRAISPLTHVGMLTPPTLTLLGTSDHIVPVDQARRLDQALSQAGVTHETYLLPGSDHGFDVNWGGFSAQFAREKIKAFLEAYG